jgi:CBS domain containing-hemolysin-like protein
LPARLTFSFDSPFAPLMGPVGLLVLYVLLALGFSFLCSILEAALLSVTPSYVAALEQEGHAVAETLRDYKDDIDRPLAAILSLNTIAHTVGATGAGAQAARVVGEGELAVALTSGVLTLLILVVSEIIPKTLGAIYWRQIAPVMALVLTVIIWAMWPFVKLSQAITRLISSGEDQEASVSREEFTAMAELGEEEGVFEEEESRILKNLFRFSSLRVRDIMTPRTVVQALHEERPIGAIIEEHDEFRFSRIPVYAENRDDITGYVLKDQILLKAAQEEEDASLYDLRRDIIGVPETLPLPELFERLVDHIEHIALVVDEYGGTAGIVTMEDVVETLLGMEIVDEADSTEDMQVLARRQWLKRAQRVNLISEDMDEVPDELRETVARFGLTGGGMPAGPHAERPFTDAHVAAPSRKESSRSNAVSEPGPRAPDGDEARSDGEAPGEPPAAEDADGSASSMTRVAGSSPEEAISDDSR